MSDGLTRRATLGVFAGGMSPLLIGASQGGDPIRADSSAALEDALRSANGRPIQVNSTVRIDRPVELAGNVILEGSGTIDLSRGGRIKIGTGVTRLPALATAIPLFGTTLRFTGDHGLVADDVIAIHNPADFSFAPYRRYYREGEMARVAQIVGPRAVRVYGVIQTAFNAQNVQLYKLNGGSLRARGLTLIPPPSGIALFLDGLTHSVIDDLTVPSGADDTAIELHRCFGAVINNPRASVLQGDAYPVIISNSQHIIINGGHGSYSTRHSLALGGRDGEATVPTADVLVTGLIADNIAAAGVGAADIHGGCKRIVYDGCLLAGAGLNGKDITYRNCTILGRPAADFADGNAMYGSEIVGGTYTLENLRIISNGTSATFGSHINMDLTQLPGDLRIVGRNLTLENVGGAPGGTFPIRVEIAGGTAAIDIGLDGVSHVGAAAPAALLRIHGPDGSARTTVRMDNVAGFDTLYSANHTLDLPFTGPGSRRGAQTRGDENVRLTRANAEHQIFATAFTANRVVALPPAAKCVPGDSFLITRTATGTFSLDIGPGLKRLDGPGRWCKFVFASGAWVLAAGGSL